MFRGEDTEFYLRRGFDVVAIDANPALVKAARLRLRTYIAGGRLAIVNAAIVSEPGPVDFLVYPDHPELSGVVNHYAERNLMRYRLAYERLGVHGILLETLLELYGVPYYLKSDIEGEDLCCLEALGRFTDRPQYISYEVDYLDADRNLAMVATASALGYRQFKLVLQGRHRAAHDGPDFDEESSGPFGEESRGRWLSREALVALFASHLDRLDWHDVHARR